MSGVQPHSTIMRRGNWIVFATTMYPDEYVEDTLRALGISFKKLNGKFDGQDESSWIVHETDFGQAAYLAEGEDCVLVLTDLYDTNTGPHRKAFQMNIATGSKVYLGWWLETGKEYAEKQSAFTFDPTQWRWWTVEKLLPTPHVEPAPRITRQEIDRNAPVQVHAASA